MTKYPVDERIFYIIWIISFILLVYSVYYQFRKIHLSERVFALKLTFYSGIMVLILYVFIRKWIVIFIMSSSHYTTGLMWTLMVSLILYMYINVCGFLKTKSSNRYEYILVIFLVMFSISGFGYFGLRIVIVENDFLYYNIFQTNSSKGIKFIAYNVLYFLLIYFISYLIERETG